MPLGVFDLSTGTGDLVALTDEADGKVTADAVRFVKAEDGPRVFADAVRIVPNTAEDALYVHADHLAKPQKMTDPDGYIVWNAAYRPFGEVDGISGTETNNLRFPGQYADIESALAYNWHRYYDPTLGRYIQSDPIGLKGGLNTYGYVGGNPIQFTDPRGFCYDPGGYGVRYCVESYIPDQSAWGFDGDNRGPRSDGGTYRTHQDLTHGPDGELETHTDPGTSKFGPLSRKGDQGPHSITEFDFGCTHCKVYTFSNKTSNGLLFGFAPNASTNIIITECDGEAVSVSGDHSPYPNVEVWQYGNGDPSLIYQYDKGSKGPSDLYGPPVPIK